MPLVVPQLRTITLGGAVTGLGIESSSFRNGLPHESVLEMDVLTGDGRIVTATPDGEHADLFFAFPNSYGSLGYAVRLRIELEPVAPYVGLRHVRFDDLDSLAKTAAIDHRRRATTTGERVDFLDGVVFEPDEAYLTLGRWTDDVAASGVLRPATTPARTSTTGRCASASRDVLTAYDYLWRWDTDWFWCSRRFGAQHPVARRLWPRRVPAQRRLPPDRRARRTGSACRRGSTGCAASPTTSASSRTSRSRWSRTADFLRWFAEHVADAAGVAVPAAAARVPTVRARRGPGRCTRCDRTAPTSTSASGGLVPIEPGRADGDVNRAIEQAVADHGGHKIAVLRRLLRRGDVRRASTAARHTSR